MLYSEIIAVCSQIHTKHINTLCGQNVECRTYRAVNTLPAALVFLVRRGVSHEEEVGLLKGKVREPPDWTQLNSDCATCFGFTRPSSGTCCTYCITTHWQNYTKVPAVHITIHWTELYNSTTHKHDWDLILWQECAKLRSSWKVFDTILAAKWISCC